MKRSSQKGFSLVQVSVLLAASGLMLSSTLPGDDAGSVNAKLMLTQQRMNKIEEASKSFMARYGRRPCPASGQYANGSQYFGVEGATAGTCTGGTPAADFTDGSNTVGGAVPTATLSLSQEYMYDGFGRRITYIVDKRATQNSSCLTMGTGAITVKATSGGSTLSNTAVLYISHGKDGHGAFPPQGSASNARVNSGSTDTDTLDNASLNATYVTAFDANFVKKEPTSTFDDLVWYNERTKSDCYAGAIWATITPKIDDYFISYVSGANVQTTAYKTSDGSTIRAFPTVTSANFLGMFAKDANGDGLADAYIAYRGATTIQIVVYSVADGSTLLTLSTSVANANWKGITAGDVNADSKADIFLGYTNGLDTAYDVYNVVNGALINTIPTFHAAANFRSIYAIDGNNDGAADLYLAYINGANTWIGMYNSATDALIGAYNTGSATWNGLSVFHYNADGIGDWVRPQYNAPVTYGQLMSGATGTYVNTYDFGTAGTSVSGVGMGDADGDGIATDTFIAYGNPLTVTARTFNLDTCCDIPVTLFSRNTGISSANYRVFSVGDGDGI